MGLEFYNLSFALQLQYVKKGFIIWLLLTQYNNILEELYYKKQQVDFKKLMWCNYCDTSICNQFITSTTRFVTLLSSSRIFTLFFQCSSFFEMIILTINCIFKQVKVHESVSSQTFRYSRFIIRRFRWTWLPIWQSLQETGQPRSNSSIKTSFAE